MQESGAEGQHSGLLGQVLAIKLLGSWVPSAQSISFVAHHRVDVGRSEALSERIPRQKSPSAVMAFRKSSCCLCSLTQQYTHQSILHCLHLMVIEVTGAFKLYIYVPDVEVFASTGLLSGHALVSSSMDAGMGVVGAASCCSEVLVLLTQLCVCTQKFKASFKTAFVSVLFMKKPLSHIPSAVNALKKLSSLTGM